MNLISFIIDIIFFVDIMICFRTTYVNPTTGDEIWSPKMIASHYFFSARFWFDFMSSLPFDYFKLGHGIFAEFISMISMLKIVRITRINRIISNLN